jgi:hypothetical protein
MAEDVLFTYLKDYTQENMCFIAVPEFGNKDNIL